MRFTTSQPPHPPLSRRAFLKRSMWGVLALTLSAAGCAHPRVTATPHPPAPREPGLLFHAGFDRGLDADFAVGLADARSDGARLWRIAGARGQALAAFPGGAVRYTTSGNILPQRGSLEFAIKLLKGFGERPDASHRFITIQDRAAANAILIETDPADARLLHFYFQRDVNQFTETYLPLLRDWDIAAWHHLALTWDADAVSASLYADGQAVSRLPLNALPAHFDDGVIIIGSAEGGEKPAFAEFDDVRIFDTARTPGQIAADVADYNIAGRAGDNVSWSPGVPETLSLELLPPPSATFAVLADAHFARPATPDGPFTRDWRVPIVLERVQRLSPLAVVQCGDMTAHHVGGGLNEFFPAAQACKKAHSTLGIPVYYVAGNHDIGNEISLRASVGNTISESTRKRYQEMFGPDYYAIDLGDARCIIIDSQLLNATTLPACEQQWRWLKQELESAAASRYVFLFMHVSPFWAAPDDPSLGNYEAIPEPGRSRLLGLVRDHRVAGVFTGHSHHPINNRWGAAEIWTLPSTTFARVFGENYSVSSDATFYDEWKTGFALVRLYPDRFVVTPIAGFPRAYPARPLQADSDVPLKRYVPRQSKEIEDSLLGVTTSLPPIVRGRWDPAYVIDNLVGSSDLEEERRGWTSARHDAATDEEWLALDLRQERTIEAVEIVPRLRGLHFPQVYALEISRDGQEWTPVAREERPAPPTTAISLRFTPQIVRHIRLRVLRMRGQAAPFRAGVVELRALGAGGINYAPYGKATAATMQEPKAVVDDRIWQLPAWLGVKWARMQPAAWEWASIESTPGLYGLNAAQERALGAGRPVGVNLVMPLTTRHPAHVGAAQLRAFSAYARYMARTCAGCVEAWELQYAGQSTSEFDALLRVARDEISAAGIASHLVAGPFSLSKTELLTTAAARADALLVSFPLTGDAKALKAGLTECRKLAKLMRGAANVWAEIAWPDIGRVSAPAIAQRVAQAFLRFQEAGVRFFWGCLPATPGGLINAMSDPEEHYYTFQTLASLFDADVTARPLRVRALTGSRTIRIEAVSFASPDRSYIACWQAGHDDDPGPATDIAADLEITIGRVSIEKIIGVDTLSAAGQDMSFSESQGILRIPGVRISHAPNVLVVRHAP